jgi:hypothetical protein
MLEDDALRTAGALICSHPLGEQGGKRKLSYS